MYISDWNIPTERELAARFTSHSDGLSEEAECAILPYNANNDFLTLDIMKTLDCEGWFIVDEMWDIVRHYLNCTKDQWICKIVDNVRIKRMEIKCRVM
jgi:hypothetical protein